MGWEREREPKICVKLHGQRRLGTLGYHLHESQGRVGLRTHGSLILFTSRTRKNCEGEAPTINSIIVRVKYSIINLVVIIVRIVYCMQLKIY